MTTRDEERDLESQFMQRFDVGYLPVYMRDDLQHRRDLMRRALETGVLCDEIKARYDYGERKARARENGIIID